MTNLDIVCFNCFGISFMSNEDDKRAFTFTECDTPSITGHREMCTFGSPTYDPAKAVVLFERYNKFNAGPAMYERYLSSRGQQLKAIPQRPLPEVDTVPAAAGHPPETQEVDCDATTADLSQMTIDKDDDEIVPNSLPDGVENTKLPAASAKRGHVDDTTDEAATSAKKKKEEDDKLMTNANDDEDDDEQSAPLWIARILRTASSSTCPLLFVVPISSHLLIMSCLTKLLLVSARLCRANYVTWIEAF